jgi:hypothetical protein
MNDDWKGERFIRAKPSAEERATEGRRVVSVTYHKKRRKSGEPAPAAAAHSRFTRRIFFELSKEGV